MPSLLKVLAAKKDINAVLKSAVLFAFFSIFSFDVFGQNCNGITVSLGPDILACNGTNVTLTSSYTGGPSGTPTYSWFFASYSNGNTGPSNLIPNATSSTYTISNFSSFLDGEYSCVITFPNGCNDNATIVVDQPNGGDGNFDVLISQGDAFTICQGSNASINTTLSNAPSGMSVSYTWNSVPAITGAYPTVANPTFSNLPTGTYNFAVSASGTNSGNAYLGCDLVEVTVNNLNLDAGPDITICQGSSANINSTVTNAPSGSTVSYSWVSTPTSTTSNQADPNFSGLTPGITYTFTGTATVNGCTDTDQIQVTVNANPAVPTFIIPANGCPGNTIPISGFTPVAGLTYTWNDTPNSAPNVNGGNTSTPSITLNNGGTFTYTVTATNPSTGCSSTSISDAISVASVDVFPPDVSNVATPLVYLNGSLYEGVYTFDVCNASGTAQFLIENFTSNNNSNTTYTYSWGAGAPVNNFTSANQSPVLGNNPFTITASYLGCTVSESFNIYIGSNPNVSVGVGNTLDLCPGGSTSAAQITPGPLSPGTTYNLYFSNNPNVIVQSFTDITAVTTANPYVFTTGSCGYSVQGNNCIPNNQNVFYAYVIAVNACSESCANSTAITVDTPPTAAFTINPTTACTNTNVTVTSNAISGTDISGSASQGFTCSTQSKIKWTISPSTGFTLVNGNLGGTSGNWANWNGSNTLTLNFTTAGTYTITQNVQSNETCGTATISHTVCVVAPPVCAFTPSPLSGCTVLPVSITNNTTGPTCGTPPVPLALAYNWTVTNPAGGTSTVATATSVSPSIALTNNTTGILTFPINVVVNPLIPGTTTPVANCSSTCTQSVIVYPQPTFTTQPQTPASVCLGGTFNAISVVVNYLGTGAPTYQWYSNTTASSTGGTLIPGATSASYVPPATAVGTIYYYCVVTFPNNTNCNQIISNNVPAVVVPDPVATATPATQTICVGGTVPNALTGAYTNGVGTPSYQWNLVGATTPAISGATLSTYTPPAFASTGTFNYTVTINTSGSGCTASTSAQIAVVVVADPTITVPLATQTLCQNATPTALTVTASGGSGTLQYQWYSNTVNNTTNGTLINGATNSTYTPPTSAVGTLYYYCVVTTPVSGCSVTSAASTVIVIPAPTFTSQPTASNVCVGGTPTQMCVTFINGTGTPSYQWYSNVANNTTNGTAISGATASCYTPPATAAGTTYYYAIISLTGGGCSVITSNTAAVVITPDPALTTQPTSTQTICVGGSSSALTVALQASTGIGAFTYQWFSNTTATNSNGTLISGATASTYTPAPFTTNGTFYYYCVVTDAGNGCGTVTSQVATVVVVVDPTVTAPLATQTLCQTAAPAPLTVTASGGTGTFLYQWYSNVANNNTSGTLISGATASTYSPPTAAVGTMYYYCIVTTAVSGCSVTSTTSALIVNPAPNFTTQPVTSTVCVGGTTNQMCVTYANGTGTPAYQWYSNAANNTTTGTAIPSATTNCYTPPSTTAGTTYYYAIITLTGGGCASITSNTAAVIIAPDPVLTTQPTSTQTICIGGSSSALTVALQAATGLGAFTYQWYSNTTATNSGGTLISGATAATYNPSVFNAAGTFYYYCVVTDAGNGCGIVNSQVATVIVVVDPTISAQPLATQTLCQTAAPAILSVTASGGTGTLLYQWYSNTANNTTSGTLIGSATSATYTPPTAIVGTVYYYCVITTAASGCSVTSATAAIIVTQAPTFTTQPTASNVCVGGTPAQMCVVYANGTGTAEYQWYSNTANNTTAGTAILNATTNCYTPASTTAGTTYYYAVITLTGGGCSSITSNTAAVIIAPDPVLATQPTATQTFCVGGSSAPLTVVLQASTGIGAFTYQWFSNTTATNSGGTLIGSATAATYNPTVFNTAGTFYYYCVVTDAGNGCGTVTSQVATVVVVVDPTITAQPIATQTLCQTATPAVLSVTASGGTGTLLYQWYSNNANNTTSGTLIGSATSATYTPPTAIVGTVYYYCVITTAASGCSVTSATAAIIVTQAPTFTTQPTASNVCVGGTPAQMCVVYANGTGTAAYQWYSNTANSTTTGTAILSATTNCYTPPSTTAGTTYYYAVITLTGGGCSSITSNTAAVIITPDPVIATQPTASQTFCVGGSSAPLTVALQASTGIGAFTYQWYSNTTATNTGGTSIGSANAATYNPPVFNAAGTFYYYCVVTDAGNGCGTVASQVATVVVVADPAISAQPITTQTLCQTAAPAVLSVTASGGTGTLVYQWYSNTTSNTTSGTSIAGANSATYTPPTATIGTVYYYCVITTSASGCSTTTTASAVIVNPAPTFTTQPATSNVCIGGTTNQMCVAYTNGTGTATYQWYSNATNSTIGGTAVLNATNNCYTPPSATAGTTYYYAIISLTGGGCSSITSNTAEVIISTGTSLSTQPTPSQTICVGGTISAPLSVSYAGGVGTPTYQWYSSPSNTAINGATSTSYTPPTFASAGTNNYYVVVTLPGAGCGSQTSNTASIVVVPDPTATISANSSYCQNAGNVSPLAVVVTGGTGTPSYQWYSNTLNSNTGGTIISGANAISYSPLVATTGTTYYYCMITQSGTNCAVNSPAAQIIVTPAPTFTSQPTATQSVCVGGATTSFTVAYSNGTGAATYQWYSNAANSYTNGVAITTATTANYTPLSASAGTTYYYCIVSFSASGGCSMINSNIAEVVVVADPIISTQPLTTQTICVGGTISAALNVAYTGGVGTPTYQWFSAPTVSISGANTNSYSPPTFVTPGTFNYSATISLSGSGCDALTSANGTVIVVADPTATISSGASYCQNAGSVVALSVVVSNGQGTPSFQWYSNTLNSNTGGTIIPGANAISYSPLVANTGTTYYYCMITQSVTNCAVNSPAAQIIVTPAPTFTSQPAATQSVCVGGATTPFTVAYSNGTGTATYQWYSNTANSYTNGVAITTATTANYTPLSASAGTTYYYCIVSFSSSGGCSMINSNIAEVVVVPDPTISTQPLTTQTICVGGTISAALNVAYTGGVGTPTYQWFSAPTVSISGANTNSYTPPTFVTPGTFNYSATISLSGSGCDALTSTNGTVIVVADPTATISSGASYCQNAGSVVALSVVVSNGQGTPSFQWYSNTTNSNTGGTIISGANTISYSPPVANTGTTYYYCMITQSGTNCVVNSPAAQIIVTPAPTFTTQPTTTQSVCIGGAASQLNVAYSNGTGTATYQWYSNTTNSYAGGTQIAGQTLSSFTPPSTASATTYYYCIISFSADGGCSMISSDIATVIVVPDPTISTQPLTTQTICVGGTIPVAINVVYTGGLGNPTYQWFGGTPASSLTGATNSSFTPPTFTIPGTYNYYATVSLAGIGCDVLTTANASIIVVADPLVSEQPTPTQSVCQNTPTTQISVSVTGGNGSANYQWFSNTTNSNTGGTILVGETLNTFTPPSSVVGTQYYYCVINQTGANCGVTSNPAAVVVNLAPIISTQPLSAQQHCLNAVTNNLQIAYANGTGLPSYQWFVNTTNSAVGGIQINSATNNLYTPPSNIDGTFYYYCVISFVSGGGCPSIVSNVSEVIIHPYPIVTVTGGETICLLESSDINFAFTPSSGLYDITYTANGQGVTLENYNGANPLYTVTPTLTTTYVVTNIAYDQVPQCAIQPNTSIVVVVNPLPALNNSNYTFCSDVSGTSLQYTPDANTYTYDWLPNPSANYLGQNNGPSIINVTLPNPVGNAPTDFYYVTNLTNNGTGCHALDSILVTINPNPVGNFTLPTTGCINSPIPLSNGDATIGSYEWYIDGSLYSSLANPTPPIFTTLGDHTIEMVAINQYGCTDTLNSVIQIYDQPVANFTTDTDYGCAPLEVNFTNLSTGLYVTSYDWTFAPDTVSWNYQYTSSNLVDPPSVTYLQGDVTTIYTAILSVTNACGTVSAQQDITVLPTPVAEFTLATHVICSGSSLVLNNISVGEPLTYYWTYGNTISYNPNLLSMYFPSDSVTNVYPLTLTLTNACGTDTFVDSVTVLPDLVNGGFVTTADAGCSPLTVTLTNTTFNTSLSAIWNLDDPLNTVVANQNSVQFTYYATNNITQTYNPYLVVTDGCASDTIFANLSVFANPLPIISASQTNLCAGTNIDFTGSVTGGDTGFGYVWDFGGLGSSNISSPSFTFPTGSQIGTAIPITLTATSPTFSGTNCSNTTTTTLYVYENPDLTAISFNTTEGCSDLGVSISNLPAATNQINWGDGTTNFNNSHTFINNGPSLLSYNVLINSTNTYGTIPILNCSTVANQIVTIYPTPLPQIFSSSINVCEGDNIDFIASTSNNQNTGVTYFWDFGLMGTSNNANTSMVFDSGSATGLQTPIQLTAFQNTSGTICSATVSEDVFVYDTPDLTTALYSEVNGCSPLLVSITNLPTSTYTYNWGDGIISTNPNHLYLNQGTIPLNYNVIIDATTFYPTLPLLSCNAIANQTVQVNPQPFAAFTINPAESCFYAPVNTTLENTSQNAIAPYIWNYDGIAHTTNSLNYIATFTTPGAHPVELVVSNQFGCTDSVSQDFIIYGLPTVTVNAIDDDLCDGATAEFQIDGTGISTSSWNFGDGITLNLLNPTSLVHYYNQPGVYSITTIVTNIYGCSDTLFFPNEVIVHPSPTASFTTSATTADIVYPYFEFYDNSAGAINYYWNFGDSNWSNEINPTHTYNSEGNYLVELTVTNEYNCFDIATEIVSVEGIVMFVPNAFTPLDYNGINDVFKPSFSSTDGIIFYEFCIYDRWGIKLFQTNDIDEAWIGNSQEHPPGDDNYYAQNDTYIYTVRYRKKARADDPQPDQLFTGHVTIIR